MWNGNQYLPTCIRLGVMVHFTCLGNSWQRFIRKLVSLWIGDHCVTSHRGFNQRGSNNKDKKKGLQQLHRIVFILFPSFIKSVIQLTFWSFLPPGGEEWGWGCFTIQSVWAVIQGWQSHVQSHYHLTALLKSGSEPLTWHQTCSIKLWHHVQSCGSH